MAVISQRVGQIMEVRGKQCSALVNGVEVMDSCKRNGQAVLDRSSSSMMTCSYELLISASQGYTEV